MKILSKKIKPPKWFKDEVEKAGQAISPIAEKLGYDLDWVITASFKTVHDMWHKKDLGNCYELQTRWQYFRSIIATAFDRYRVENIEKTSKYNLEWDRVEKVIVLVPDPMAIIQNTLDHAIGQIKKIIPGAEVEKKGFEDHDGKHRD